MSAGPRLVVTRRATNISGFGWSSGWLRLGPALTVTALFSGSRIFSYHRALRTQHRRPRSQPSVAYQLPRERRSVEARRAQHLVVPRCRSFFAPGPGQEPRPGLPQARSSKNLSATVERGARELRGPRIAALTPTCPLPSLRPRSKSASRPRSGSTPAAPQLFPATSRNDVAPCRTASPRSQPAPASPARASAPSSPPASGPEASGRRNLHASARRPVPRSRASSATSDRCELYNAPQNKRLERSEPASRTAPRSPTASLYLR